MSLTNRSNYSMIYPTAFEYIDPIHSDQLYTKDDKGNGKMLFFPLCAEICLCHALPRIIHVYGQLGACCENSDIFGFLSVDECVRNNHMLRILNAYHNYKHQNKRNEQATWNRIEPSSSSIYETLR